jgi:hypothetical protein
VQDNTTITTTAAALCSSVRCAAQWSSLLCRRHYCYVCIAFRGVATRRCLASVYRIVCSTGVQLTVLSAAREQTTNQEPSDDSSDDDEYDQEF